MSLAAPEGSLDRPERCKIHPDGAPGKVNDVDNTSTVAGTFNDMSAVDTDGKHISLLRDGITRPARGTRRPTILTNSDRVLTSSDRGTSIANLTWCTARSELLQEISQCDRRP